MTDPEPYDATFDLGGLPGGEVLFTDSAAKSTAEPSPTVAVPPLGATVYRLDPASTAPAATTPARPSVPTPPARWPRPATDAPANRRPAPPNARPSGPTPARRRAVVRRRRRRHGAWPLVGLLIWGVPAAVHLFHRPQPEFGSSSASSAVSAPAVGGVLVDSQDMTTLRPHSIKANSSSVTIHIDAPSTGSYTITEGGAPLDSHVTRAYDLGLGGTATADSLVVASSDDAATIRCEIRDAQGEVVATGEATGTLDCAYDPDILLE